MLRNIDIVDQMFSRIAPSDLVRYIELGGGQPPSETPETIRNNLESTAPRPSSGALEYMLAHYDPNSSQARAPDAYKAAAGFYSAGKEAGFYTIDRSEAGGLELTLYRPTVMFMDQDGVQVDDKEVLKEIKGKQSAGKKTASEKEASKFYSIDSKALKTEKYALMDVDGTYVALELPSKDSGYSIDNLTKEKRETTNKREKGLPEQEAYEEAYNALYSMYQNGNKSGTNSARVMNAIMKTIPLMEEIKLEYYQIPSDKYASALISDGSRQDSLGGDGGLLVLVKVPRVGHDQNMREISGNNSNQEMKLDDLVPKIKDQTSPAIAQNIVDTGTDIPGFPGLAERTNNKQLYLSAGLH